MSHHSGDRHRDTSRGGDSHRSDRGDRNDRNDRGDRSGGDRHRSDRGGDSNRGDRSGGDYHKNDHGDSHRSDRGDRSGGDAHKSDRVQHQQYQQPPQQFNTGAQNEKQASNVPNTPSEIDSAYAEFLQQSNAGSSSGSPTTYTAGTDPYAAMIRGGNSYAQQFQQQSVTTSSYDDYGLSYTFPPGISSEKESIRDEYIKPNKSREVQSEQDTIYISGLPTNITEKELQEKFGSIGVIKIDKKKRQPKIWIYRDKATNEPKGDAAITYEDPVTASSAIRWFDGKDFKGNKLHVELAQPRKQPPGGWGRGRGRGRGRGNVNITEEEEEGFPEKNEGGGRGRGRGRGIDDGTNWTCSACNSSNFQKRQVCFRCQAPRDGARSGGFNAGNQQRASDRNDRRDRPY